MYLFFSSFVLFCVQRQYVDCVGRWHGGVKRFSWYNYNEWAKTRHRSDGVDFVKGGVLRIGRKSLDDAATACSCLTGPCFVKNKWNSSVLGHLHREVDLVLLLL